MRHHRIRPDDRVVTDDDARANESIGADPHAIANQNVSTQHRAVVDVKSQSASEVSV